MRWRSEYRPLHIVSLPSRNAAPRPHPARSYGARGSLVDRPAVARSTDCTETARRSRALTRAGCADSIWRSACVGRIDSQRALGETLGSQARHRPCERPTTTDISTTAHRAAHCGCGHCGMRQPSGFERGSDGGCVRLRRNGCSKAALSSVPPRLQAWLLLYPLYWNKDKRANAVPMGAATCCRYLKDGVERNMDYDYVVRSFGCSA